MSIRFALLVILILSVVSIVPSVAADSNVDRFALVIGNAKYPFAEAPLKEPINDARDVANELKHDGFSVDVGENLTGQAMRDAFDRLYGRIKPGSVVLVFFSGFGIQSARQSYLIPVDAQIWAEADVRRDGISLETMLDQINNRGAGIKIALIDASRRNPYERLFRQFSAGLAPVVAPRDTLVMYSAAPGSVVSDDGRDHSLFVQELLKEIRVPGLAEEALNRTRVGVTRASLNQQIPWISSSLAEDFSFIPGSGAPPQPPGLEAKNQIPQEETVLPPRDEVPKKQDVVPPLVVDKPEKEKLAEKKDEPLEKKDEPLEKKEAAPLSEDPIIKELSDRLAKNPDDENALYRRGQVYASKGAYSLAINDFSDSLRLNPKGVEAFNNRCWARAVTGDLPAALKDCNEALRLRPNFVDALDSRGLVNLKSGNAKNAIADFDAALKINPRLTSSLYGRGLAKQRNGSISEGERDLSNAKAMDPNIVKEFASYGVP
jgi:tetratricopeptide (TPR) repeat protein